MNSIQSTNLVTEKTKTIEEKRIREYNVESNRLQCEHKTEMELSELLSQEKARSRMQELEIERREHQLKESTELIRKLQDDLERVRRNASNKSWDLRENELIAKNNTEIINLRTKMTELEEQIKNKQIELECTREKARNEISEVKQQKASLRFEHVKLEKRFLKLETDYKTFNEKQTNFDKINEEKKNYRCLQLRTIESENKKLLLENEELKNKLNDLERKLQENESRENAQLTDINSELKMQHEKCENWMKNAKDLDEQCEKLMAKLRELHDVDIKQKTLLNENTLLKEQIDKFRQQEQSQKENNGTQINRLQQQELDLINENTLLRQKFAECLKKAEIFRDQFEDYKQKNSQLKLDLQNCNERMTKLEDELFELRGEMEQKDKLVAYLECNAQPKQLKKVSGPRQSLLTSDTDFLSELELEFKKCQQLERHRNQLKIDLEQKHKVLAEKQNGNESVPLLKNQQHKDQSKSDIAISSQMHSSTESSIYTQRTPGKMRHDIPHRWKRQFITVTSNRCRVCMECLPYFNHIFRCHDCSMTVHQHCKQVVANTCGLPSECADFYLDTYSTSKEETTMNGWIKLLTSSTSDRPLEKWRNAWASIEEHKLFFYETDQLALGSQGDPFISIDLDKEHWRIYNQTTDKPVNGVSGEDMSLLIELRMSSCTLFMMVPTIQAKQRWIYALQYATNRRIFIQRKPSSTVVNNLLLLALESPQNLTVNCTQILQLEWLLIGAHEGLFATSILQQQQIHAPFHIAGISRVYSMESLPEFDMLLTICGLNRQLMVIHLQQLYLAFKSDQQPSIHLTTVSNIQQCHIMTVSKPENIHKKRFVYIATIDSIIILQYITKLGIFSPINQFKTEEPCMCICPTSNGFIFGADNFYFAKFESNSLTKSQLMVDNCPFDIPVAIVNISDNEYLLAYHNFGLFVDPQGNRTRINNVEWDKVPLEFIYKTPYLYIVYCEFLEVVRLAPQIGLESGTLTDDRNIFKCQSAHCTGSGLLPSEVLFVVSNENMVELHSFGHSNMYSQEGVRSVTKRKIDDQIKQLGTKKKSNNHI